MLQIILHVQYPTESNERAAWEAAGKMLQMLGDTKKINSRSGESKISRLKCRCSSALGGIVVVNVYC